MLSKRVYKLLASLAVGLLLVRAGTTNAAVNIDRTRIIMDGSDKSLAVTLTNQSKTQPYLAQSWIDDANGKRSESYLLALPPLQRIDAGKKRRSELWHYPLLPLWLKTGRHFSTLTSAKSRRKATRKMCCKSPCRVV